MSTTTVEIIANGSFRAAQPMQVLIVAGSAITFTAPADGSAVLSLTASTASLLSPSPSSQTVEIAAGTSVTFTFGDPGSQSYCCQVVADMASAHAIQCPDTSENAVLTILSSDRDLMPPPPRSSGR